LGAAANGVGLKAAFPFIFRLVFKVNGHCGRLLSGMHAQRGASLLTFSISRFWNTRKQKNEIGSHLNIYTSAAAFSAGQKGREKHAIQAERFSTPTCLQ